MATPFSINFTEDDVKERASYEDLEAGKDYIATLTQVDDIVASTGNPGWAFVFDVQGLPLTTRVYLRGGGKWKVREVFNALGQPIDGPAMDLRLDPNDLVGNKCVVTISKELRDPAAGADGGYWTNIGRHTPFVTEVTETL